MPLRSYFKLLYKLLRVECEENGRTGTRKESSGYMSISGPLFKPETSRGVFFFVFFLGYLKLAIIMLSTEGGRRQS